MRSYDARPTRWSRIHRTTSLRTAALLTTALAVGCWAEGAQAADDDTIPFDVAEVYFELNDTDGDLGIHALIDGEPWKALEIESPHERRLLGLWLTSNLRRQGLTELFFESAEPAFDELPPRRFFRRFPEGQYEIAGRSLDGEELESIAIVTHLLPAPPAVAVNGEPLPEDCDEDPIPAVGEPFVVTWDPVTLSHPDLGRTNEPIEVTAYQVVVEREPSEEPEDRITALKLTFDLSPDVTRVKLPRGLLNPGDEIKIEVLVREASHNQTATETCFDVDD